MMKIKYDIKGVVVDYLQILNVNMKGSNKEQQMGDVARRLKNIAKELDIWVIALSQLNRDSMNPQPSLSRLRDSGQIAEAADIKRSFEITGNALVAEPSQALRDMWNDMMRGKMDVTIGQEVGKLPRKMKKALHSKRMSKWKHKVASYISRRQVRIHDAEMVVTPDQFDTLKATVSGGTIEHGCVVSGKQISEALERYKHRHS